MTPSQLIVLLAAAAHDPKKEEQSIPDPDPEGTKLLKDVDALSEISRLLRPLQRLLPRNIEVQLASFELYHRQSELVAALHAGAHCH
jgi:peptide alpha-N-acetyltransferase